MLEVNECITQLERCIKGENAFVEDDVFHHNTAYRNGLLVLKYGILSARLQGNVGLQRRKQFVNIYGYRLPIDNVNENECVSVARLLNEEPFGGKLQYLPYKLNLLDLRIDRNLSLERKVFHDSKNYYNEYLVQDEIAPSFIRSIDLRFHNLCSFFNSSGDYCLSPFVESFDQVIAMARYIEDHQLNVDMREIVDNEKVYILDTKKISRL